MVSTIRRTLLACLQVYKQWGVVTDDRSTLTFLLPFSNSDYFYAAFPTNKVNVGGINLHGVRHPTYLELYSSISNDSDTANNWQFSGRIMNTCWLAVGIQQWGRSTAATLNFSLPFQKFYCITTAQESWTSATFNNTSWIARTNSSITWPTYQSTNINYIAVGMQQCFKRCAFGKAQALPMATHQKPAQPLPAS